MADFNFGLDGPDDMIRKSAARFTRERVAPLPAAFGAETWPRAKLWPRRGASGLQGMTA